MNRRDFLKTTAISMAGMAILPVSIPKDPFKLPATYKDLCNSGKKLGTKLSKLPHCIAIPYLYSLSNIGFWYTARETIMLKDKKAIVLSDIMREDDTIKKRARTIREKYIKDKSGWLYACWTAKPNTLIWR